MGLEICDQVPDFDALLVPIGTKCHDSCSYLIEGGAGLIAGVSLACKMIHSEGQVIGVEAANCPSFSSARAAGKPVVVNCTPTLADGLAVPMVGENAFKVAHKFVDKVFFLKSSVLP